MAARSLRALRRIPLVRLLAAAELVALARRHYVKLGPRERRRFLELLTRARGRPSRLSKKERIELASLVAKAEPRLFAELVVEKLVGVKLPPRDRTRRPPGSK